MCKFVTYNWLHNISQNHFCWCVEILKCEFGTPPDDAIWIDYQVLHIEYINYFLVPPNSIPMFEYLATKYSTAYVLYSQDVLLVANYILTGCSIEDRYLLTYSIHSLEVRGFCSITK